jgi:energy-coupling factor transporter ATP-binding protein EcfA2
VIICLFGPTGVGKTDLVRQLVKLLAYQDKYCEVELTNKAQTWRSSIGTIIKQNAHIESGNPGIVLLDEIQGFRTIDEQGNDILDYDMKDIWTLLSDGKLPYRGEVESLMSMFWDIKKKDIIKVKIPTVKKQNKPAKRQKGGFAVGKRPFTRKETNDLVKKIFARPKVAEDSEDSDDKLNYYDLKYFKSVLRLQEPIEEIALWSEEKKKSVIASRMMDNSIYDEEDYTKTLIFISGNIDEAYPFVKNAKEVDVDADIIHDISKQVNILGIKQALGKRFRPEQISRMGNMHVIYPSLSRKSFETIISRKITAIVERVKNQTGILLNIDSSINKVIYDNGVFPTQGTRPLFSTISEILETSIPNFVLRALIDNYNNITIKYESGKIIGAFKEERMEILYFGELDKLKNKHHEDLNRKSIAATHEAAHAIVHAVLFKMAPSQIVSSPVSDDMEGFVYSQDFCTSKEMIKNRISVCLAGYEAEKIVFGDDFQTSGSQEDIEKATTFAARMVRDFGMYGNKTHISNIHKEPFANYDLEPTNKKIEVIINDCSQKTKTLIIGYKDLFLAVIDELMKKDKISPEEFQGICKQYNLTISIAKSAEEVLYDNYFDKLNDFKNKS